MRSYIEHRYLGQVLQRLPLPPDVIDGAHDHDVLQLVVVEVGGPGIILNITLTYHATMNGSVTVLALSFFFMIKSG